MITPVKYSFQGESFMQLNIGTKIHELRRRDERTQEALAEALGVTAQAVSRWESGGSYPDVELMPAIANYFHISIDELFGYHDDREEKIKSIIERADNVFAKQGRILFKGSLSEDVEECIDMLRTASEEFPNEPKILLKLAQALFSWGYHKYGEEGRLNDTTGIIEESAEYNTQNVYWQESMRVYEKMLKSNPSPEDHEVAVCQLMHIYSRMGEYEKAKALANVQSAVSICKEVLLPLSAVGEEKARYRAESLTALISRLKFTVFESVATRPEISGSGYGIQLLMSVNNLYETVFADGRCGKYHWEIGHAYMVMSHYAAANNESIDTVIDYFDKGFDHCKEYQRICDGEEYKYTAPLVSDLKSIAKGELAPLGEDFWKRELQMLPPNIHDELRKNEKYDECFA